jgi:hypothetical protein
MSKRQLAEELRQLEAVTARLREELARSMARLVELKKRIAKVKQDHDTVFQAGKTQVK